MKHLIKIRKIAQDFRTKIESLNLRPLPQFGTDDPMEPLSLVESFLPEKRIRKIAPIFRAVLNGVPQAKEDYLEMDYFEDDHADFVESRDAIDSTLRTILARNGKPTIEELEEFHDAALEYSIAFHKYQIGLLAAALETEHRDNDEAQRIIDLIFRRVNRWSDSYQRFLAEAEAEEKQRLIEDWVADVAKLVELIAGKEACFFFPSYEADSDFRLLNQTLSSVGVDLSDIYAAYGHFIAKRFGTDYQCKLLEIDMAAYFRWLAKNCFSNDIEKQIMWLHQQRELVGPAR